MYSTPCYLCECGRGKEEGGPGNQIPGSARDKSAKRFKSATNECVFPKQLVVDSGPPRFPGLGVVKHPFSIPRLLLRSFFCSSQKNRSLRFNITSFYRLKMSEMSGIFRARQARWSYVEIHCTISGWASSAITPSSRIRSGDEMMTLSAQSYCFDDEILNFQLTVPSYMSIYDIHYM